MSISIRQAVRRIPLVGDVALFFYRLLIGLKYFRSPINKLFNWLYHSNETSNFTYDLTEINKKYLASLIYTTFNKPFDEIYGYMSELENNEHLRNHVITMSDNTVKTFDKKVWYGRRVGWYAIARATKPQIIVETGVDKGLGSCVLVSALMKNAEEGFSGHYYGTDINPEAGQLFASQYKEYGEILYGDSIGTLQNLDKVIDLFINDSEHTQIYEENEYKTIKDCLSQNAVILGDNSHNSEKLFEFAMKTNRHFVFFKEEPNNHWYPGAGIGIAFRKTNPIG